ncbi:hypothetical protein GMJAKD_11155 [Candidatus Electrothrix aarhusensis]
MTNDGTNYWYVEAESAVTSTPIRYPSTDTLSFTVSITQDKKPIITPMLMLLLKGDSVEPPRTTAFNDFRQSHALVDAAAVI